MDTLIGAVPDGWLTRRMDQCCQIQTGPSGDVLKASDYVMTGIPVVMAGDIRAEGLTASLDKHVSAATAERLFRYRLCPGDIVLTRIGMPPRFAVVNEHQDGWLFGNAVIRFRTTSDVISAAYLARYLAHPAVHEWLVEHTIDSVLPTRNARMISTLPLVLPPPAVQQEVVEVARRFDEKILAHERVIETTRALRDLLLPRLLAGDFKTPDR